MVDKSQIKYNLNQLNRLYEQSKGSKKRAFYSKLAILELCGWIEYSVDDIIKSYADNRLLLTVNINLIKEAIKRTSSFAYDYSYHERHFRNMLVDLIGIINLEKLETIIQKKGHFEKMRSAISALKLSRDRLAHTYVAKANETLDEMENIDAPSITKQRLDDVYSGLKEIERYIQKEKYLI